MSYTLFTLIFAGITALSTIAAFISCFIMYKTTRPKVSLTVNDKNDISPQSIFSSFELKGEKVSLAKICINVKNLSPVVGTITDIFIEYKNQKYYTSSIYTNIDINPKLTIKIQKSKDNFINELMELRDPISLTPYFSLDGFLTIPNFAFIMDEDIINVYLCFNIVGKRKFYRIPITLYRISPTVSTNIS